MKTMRRAQYGNPDANQAEIVDALRQVGASVAITSGVGRGFPDLVVGRHGVTYLVEVKPGDAKDKRQRRLRPSQEEFKATWRGRPVAVLRSVSDALRMIGVIE